MQLHANKELQTTRHCIDSSLIARNRSMTHLLLSFINAESLGWLLISFKLKRKLRFRAVHYRLCVLSYCEYALWINNVLINRTTRGPEYFSTISIPQSFYCFFHVYMLLAFPSLMFINSRVGSFVEFC